MGREQPQHSEGDQGGSRDREAEAGTGDFRPGARGSSLPIDLDRETDKDGLKLKQARKLKDGDIHVLNNKSQANFKDLVGLCYILPLAFSIRAIPNPVTSACGSESSPRIHISRLFRTFPRCPTVDCHFGPPWHADDLLGHPRS
jgi:hypothetical protein